MSSSSGGLIGEARSLKELIETVTDLAAHGIELKSLKENIDTTTPTGKFMFHIMAALTEFERDLISERTQAGLEAARARGRQGGRPAVTKKMSIDCFFSSNIRDEREAFSNGSDTMS